MTTLYICYFGLRQPLVQTQVLPYLRELVRGGVKVLLLTFEPEPRKNWDAAAIAVWRDRLRGDGIEWHRSTYHRSPSLPATLFDILAGALRATFLVRRHRVDLLHARSHVPAAMGALAGKLTRAKLLFDIRGLLADEYVDAGRWSPNGLAYRLTKSVERYLCRTADAFVVLTDRARAELFGNRALETIEVIPCCVDAKRFTGVPAAAREKLRREIGATDRIVIVYAGSLGGLYLTHELADFLAAARSSDGRVFPLVLTQSAPDLIARELTRVGFGSADFHVTYARPDELPTYLAASDIGVSLIRATYSKLASSPTKVAEYLAAGMPVISSSGMGDLDAQLEQEGVGVVLKSFDAASSVGAFERAQRLRAEDCFRDRCREVARRLYDLEAVGGVRYRRLYENVAKLP